MSSPTTQHEFKRLREGAQNWDDFIRDNWSKADKLIPKSGLKSNRPTAGIQNRVYFAHDTQEIFYDDGASWIDVATGDHDNLLNVSTSDHHIRPSAGTLLTEDTNNNFNVDEGSISHDGIDQTTVSTSDHHIRPSAGTLLTEDTNNNFNVDEGSISHDGIDQTTVSSGDHHTRYADEEAQDAVGTILGALFTYDDATPTITLDEGEISHDAIDQTTVSTSDHHTRYSDEEAQDAVGTILSAQFTYDDTNNAITLDEGEGSGLDADQWEGYDLQKNGTDGTGIINFKT